MVALIKCRADQVVHPCINNEESFLRGLFDIANASYQNTGIADQQAPWFDQDAQSEFAQRRQDRRRIIIYREWQFARRFDPSRFAPPFAATTGKRRFVNNSITAP